MRPREIKYRDGKLIFEDYAKREVCILEEDYLNLMAASERRLIRPNLEDCLKNPTEMWWEVMNVDGEDYTVYKYFKLFSDGVFIVFAILDEFQNFTLNNFFFFDLQELEKINEVRRGMLIFSKLK